jgi:hypothetical protein
MATQKTNKSETNLWLVVGGSATGKAHLANNTPCQDAFCNGRINSKWYISVVSDGAGSYEHSHLGSAFATKNAVAVFKDMLKDEPLLRDNSIPNAAQWRDMAITGLSFVYDNMRTYAVEKGIHYKSLGCTIILALYSSDAFLIAHIGDGRAAVKTGKDKWIPAMVPFKGEEMGATTFITSDATWYEASKRIGASVIRQSIKAFALLTDGLETYTFSCNKKKDDSNSFYDPNEPFSAFFDHNTYWIKHLHSTGKTTMQIEDTLSSYLHDGHPAIAGEGDDKTIVMGALNS